MLLPFFFLYFIYVVCTVAVLEIMIVSMRMKSVIPINSIARREMKKKMTITFKYISNDITFEYVQKYQKRREVLIYRQMLGERVYVWVVTYLIIEPTFYCFSLYFWNYVRQTNEIIEQRMWCSFFSIPNNALEKEQGVREKIFQKQIIKQKCMGHDGTKLYSWRKKSRQWVEKKIVSKEKCVCMCVCVMWVVVTCF